MVSIPRVTPHLPMKHRFKKHYTREEARALLPQIRKWLERLSQLRHVLERYEKRLDSLMKQGHDAGGQTVTTRSAPWPTRRKSWPNSSAARF